MRMERDNGASQAPGKGPGTLHVAAYNADSDAVTELIQSGAPVEERDGAGFTPLHWACFRARVGDQTPIIRSLAAGGADVNALTGDGSSHCLMLAAEAGGVEAVETLLGLGADVNARADDVTALMAAARQGEVEIAQMLLRFGADTTLKAGRFTASDYAAHGGHSDLAHLLASD